MKAPVSDNIPDYQQCILNGGIQLQKSKQQLMTISWKLAFLQIILLVGVFQIISSEEIGDKQVNYTKAKEKNLNSSAKPFGLTVIPKYQDAYATPDDNASEGSQKEDSKVPVYQPFYSRIDEAQQLGLFKSLSSTQLSSDPSIKLITDELQKKYFDFIKSGFVISGQKQEKPKTIYKLSYTSSDNITFQIITEILQTNIPVKIVSVSQKQPQTIITDQSLKYFTTTDSLIRSIYSDFLNNAVIDQASSSLSLNYIKYAVRYKKQYELYSAQTQTSLNEPILVKIRLFNSPKKNITLKFLIFTLQSPQTAKKDANLGQIDNYIRQKTANFKAYGDTKIFAVATAPGKTLDLLNYFLTYQTNSNFTEVVVSYNLTSSLPSLLYLKAKQAGYNPGDNFRQIDFIVVWDQPGFEQALKSPTKGNPLLQDNNWVITRVEILRTISPIYRVTYYLISSGSSLVVTSRY